MCMQLFEGDYLVQPSAYSAHFYVVKLERCAAHE